jgi:ATP-dependent protease ClpP protease subunit
MKAELLITGYIGWDPRRDAKQLPQNTAEDIEARCAGWKAQGVTNLAVRILNCPGGNVSHGLAIHDVLAGCGLAVSTSLEGMTGSAATLVFEAGKPRRMSANALMLIHRATLPNGGNRHEMVSNAESLDSIDARQADIYAKRAGAKAADMLAMMDANTGNGRWLSATEAKAAGLVDEVYEPDSKPVGMAAADLAGLALPPVPLEFAALFVAPPEQTRQPVTDAASAAKEQHQGAKPVKITADQATALRKRFGDALVADAAIQDLEYADAVSLGADILANALAEIKADAVKVGTERDAAKAEVTAIAAKLAAAEAKLADPLKASEKRDPPATPPSVKPIPEACADLIAAGKTKAEAFALLRTERPQDYAAHFSMR